MFRQLVVPCVALFCAIAPGHAADLAGVPVIPAPVSPFSWTGAYAGLSFGYSFGGSQDRVTTGTRNFVSLPASAVPSRFDPGSDGIIAGGQIGYNIQGGFLVAGLETDLSYVDQSNKKSFVGAPIAGIAPQGLVTSGTQRLSALGTVRARLGVVVTESILVYATGGLAYGRVSSSGAVDVTGQPALSWRGSSAGWDAGWTLGGGSEIALAENLTLKGEYLYYDLGGRDVSATGNAAVRNVAALNGVDYAAHGNTRGSIVRVGLNWKF